MSRHGPTIALCLVALCVSRLVIADDVVLANGDRLSGRLLHKSGDVLAFETPPAGQLKIRWSDVVALSTDREVEIWLAGEARPRRAVLSSAYDGTVDLVGDESDVPLVRIAFINPTPEESGVGALYNGHVTASATRVRGNTDTQQSYADADFTGRSRDYRYTLTGKFSQNRDHGVKIASNWLFTGNVDYFLTAKRFLYLRGSRESDRFKGVDRRSTVGAGYGVQLIETLRTNVALRAGIDYVNLNRLPPEDDTRYPAIGWGVRAAHKLAERGTELFHEQDGYLNLRNSQQITLRSRSGVRVPLYIGLNASAQVNLDWDRDPTPGRKALDTTLLLGLGYTW
jgi:putative salt-induced outer membrane protein YdiY